MAREARLLRDWARVGQGRGRFERSLLSDECREVRSTCTIVDADGLFLVAQDPALISGVAPTACSRRTGEN